jgi:hypothetical protein
VHRTSRRSSRRRRLALILAAVAAIGPAAGARTASAAPPRLLAAGDGSANFAMDSARKLALTRWVARRTGVLHTLYLHIKVEGSANCPYGGRAGYASGTTGVMRVTTHLVLPDGRPDMGVALATDQFQPCARQVSESVAVRLDLSVVKGQEFATVVRNVDPDAAHNWFSQNFLYAANGLVGANARNERNPAATDALYGLDPRELVGYSPDGGATWWLPGGPNTVAKYIPSYIQQYADGSTAGQPYYSAAPLSGPVTMTYPKIAGPWTITQLGAYTYAPGSSTVRLLVNGVQRASARLSGTGMLSAPITAVTAPAGSTVQVATTAGPSGLALRKMYSDTIWAGLMGLGTAAPFYLEGDPERAATVYALPGG